MKRKKGKHEIWFGNGETHINKARVLVLASTLNMSFAMDVVELSEVKFFIFIWTFSPIKQRFYFHCYRGYTHSKDEEKSVRLKKYSAQFSLWWNFYVVNRKRLLLEFIQVIVWIIFWNICACIFIHIYTYVYIFCLDHFLKVFSEVNLITFSQFLNLSKFLIMLFEIMGRWILL